MPRRMLLARRASDRSRPHGTLYGHFARANPHAQIAAGLDGESYDDAAATASWMRGLV